MGGLTHKLINEIMFKEFVPKELKKDMQKRPIDPIDTTLENRNSKQEYSFISLSIFFFSFSIYSLPCEIHYSINLFTKQKHFTINFPFYLLF